MLDNLAIGTGLIGLLAGAAFLQVGMSKPDANQSLLVLSGAALLSIGLITICLAFKSKWAWKRIYKKYRES